MGRHMLPRPTCKVCQMTCKSLGWSFCSRACANKAMNYSYAIGNKWAYKGNKSGKWAHYKRMQKLCPPGPCSACGSADKSIIHHKDHNPLNTVSENLERLCRPCHINHHRKQLKKRAA